MFSTPPKATAFPPGSILGSILGDIIGSIYERNPIKHKNFAPLIHDWCGPTDDTVLTVATMEALLNPKQSSSSPFSSFASKATATTTTYDYAYYYRDFGRRHPHAGYGAAFRNWLRKDDSGPYNSWGNGSAMRVSPIGWYFDDRDTVLEEARKSAMVTHNHPEGIKGAQAVALAIFLARNGCSKDDIRMDIETSFGYDLSSRTVDEIRPTYGFDVSCQKSVPESILCFLESDNVEDAARLAVSLGGDADTQACIACGIAEAYYGPLDLNGSFAKEVRSRLPQDLVQVVDGFGRERNRRQGIGG